MARNLFIGEEKNILTDSRTFEERQQELELSDKLESEKNKREKNSTFDRWSQFNLEYANQLIDLALNHPKAHGVLYFLINHMDNYNAVMCSYAVLEETLNVSTPTIQRSIKTLKDLGFIAIYKSGSSNVYAINDSIFWKSWGKNKKYSKFPANVILTESEQPKIKKDKITEIKIKK